MKCICAWCKHRYKDKQPYEDEHITHIICSPCQKKEILKLIGDYNMAIYKNVTGELIEINLLNLEFSELKLILQRYKEGTVQFTVKKES